ncbi:MAG: serine--tRNA ligase, partial [Bacteroidales bacterium]|nr:serine--tRNA ligase [Bacteroidales bacterium]
MLTMKLITEQYDRVIAGLNKKHFNNAKEAIDAVIAKDQERRATQKELDENLAKSNQLAKSIGALMKEGKKAEAETAKAEVAELKTASKALDEKKAALEEEIVKMLCQIPNIQYDEVPEGTCAEDNWVVKSNLKECVIGQDTVGNWD